MVGGEYRPLPPPGAPTMVGGEYRPLTPPGALSKSDDMNTGMRRVMEERRGEGGAAGGAGTEAGAGEGGKTEARKHCIENEWAKSSGIKRTNI